MNRKKRKEVIEDTQRGNKKERREMDLDLPEHVVEQIVQSLHMKQDISTCIIVCKKWQKIAEGMLISILKVIVY